MTLFSKAVFYLKSFFLKKKLDAQLTEEVRTHLDMATEANIAAGMQPEEARYAALRHFGNVVSVQEQARDEHGWMWLEDGMRDLRHSFRSLVRDKGFTLITLSIIAFCLAANVIIFSVINGVLLRPLPFNEPDRLVTVYNSYPKAGVTRAGVSAPHYLERRDGVPAFADAGAMRDGTVTIDIGGASQRVLTASITPSFFHVLGMDAALGRIFSTGEDVTGKDQVVLLSDGFWRENYNADPAVIGRTLRIDNTPRTIIGVMPPGFRYLSHEDRLWLPLVFTEEERRNRHGGGGEMVARLRPGATIREAQAQVDALNERMLKIDDFAAQVISVGFHSTVTGLHADHVAELRPVLLLLQAGVLCLLFIGTVNLANLFMIRATGRAREFALRQVLGAGRGKLVRALLAESLGLSLVGGLLGLVLGAAAQQGMVRLAGTLLPAEYIPGLDITVSLLALGTAAMLGMFLALPVIWLTLHGRLEATLATASRSGTTTRPVQRLRQGLIVAQIALAFVLLSGAGLLGMSFLHLLEEKPGFRPDNLLTAAVALPPQAYAQTNQRDALAGRLLTEMRSLPGIGAATLSTGLPFSHRNYRIAWELAGDGARTDEFIKEGLYTCWISDDYFTTLGVPLREGRMLELADVQAGRKICVVDEQFARRHWPAGEALGHRLVLPRDPAQPDEKREYFEIVGVVGSVKQNDLSDRTAADTLYLPIAAPSDFMVTVRTRLAPEATGALLREAIHRLDSRLDLSDLKPMETRIRESISGRRTPLFLVGIFAAAALLLAAIGIYGVLAYSVAQRQRDIGVRMALGALPGQIEKQFIHLGIRLLSLGLPLGILGAWMAGRTMAGMLFGTTPTNPVVFGGTAVVLTAVAMLACLLPARRAARISPLEALRAE